jgi:hypothetical protein
MLCAWQSACPCAPAPATWRTLTPCRRPPQLATAIAVGSNTGGVPGASERGSDNDNDDPFDGQLVPTASNEQQGGQPLSASASARVLSCPPQPAPHPHPARPPPPPPLPTPAPRHPLLPRCRPLGRGAGGVVRRCSPAPTAQSPLPLTLPLPPSPCSHAGPHQLAGAAAAGAAGAARGGPRQAGPPQGPAVHREQAPLAEPGQWAGGGRRRRRAARDAGPDPHAVAAADVQQRGQRRAGPAAGGALPHQQGGWPRRPAFVASLVLWSCGLPLPPATPPLHVSPGTVPLCSQGPCLLQPP